MSNQENNVHILGVGDDGLEGLTSAAGAILKSADLIIGPERLLSLIGQSPARKFVTHGDPERIAEVVTSNPGARIVVLADGDPLFYGTARFLCDRLGKDRVEVVPHVSSMQLAFARVKEQWDEAYLTNLAHQDLDRAIERIRSAERAGIFTTEQISPAVVARALLDRGIDYFTGYVCENLGSPDERVTHAELSEIAQQLFSALNVMILVRKPGMPDRPREMVGHRLFGNPDETFLQSRPKRGLLTPAEVRCIALAEMDLGPSSVVWDVGAGSGAVAVEAALLAPGGQIYAIEMDAEDYQLITENADRFSATNLIPVLGQAPDAWETLPDPDAVFVGGAGRQVSQIVEKAFARLRPGGRIVTNVVSIENVRDVQHGVRRLAGESNIWMINIARGTQQLESTRFDSTPPTFLIGARKPQR
ncbi:MAG: precorrin-6y C5,15-methyltransferase (decarboxylating) subunit CbiE [Planctomycetota bacterium]